MLLPPRWRCTKAERQCVCVLNNNCFARQVLCLQPPTATVARELRGASCVAHANDVMSMFCMKRIAISALRTQQWRGLRVPAMASAQGAPPLAAAAAVPAVLIVLVVDTSVGMTVTTSHVGMTGLDHAKHAVRAAVASTMWQPCGIPNCVVVYLIAGGARSSTSCAPGKPCASGGSMQNRTLHGRQTPTS